LGYLVSPPRHIEDKFFAVFALTNDADDLAVGFLESRGIDAKLFPSADVSRSVFGGVLGNLGSTDAGAYVCVPQSQIEAAVTLLKSESGLID
jgi:hypothetical protein